jgi:4-hydroxybenzoyl-CoA thioesterase/acyl-CoA thioester hydrolase
VISEYRLRRRVQFYETDTAGVVHFSWYFRYMEEAEHAMWREAGLSIHAPESEFVWPRVAATCDYHRPLRFEQEFDIVIRIVEIGARTIRYACELTDGTTTFATGSLTIACVTRQPDGRLKTADIPADVVARFAVAAGAGA